jgi:hypothetical protein
MVPCSTTRIRRAPRRAPCPHCGRWERRKRILHRRLRTLAYPRCAWLEVTYAEYQATCGCCKYFRTWPLDVPPKADYDATVRHAVLDRLLRDHLNVQQTREAMLRDFLVPLSEGFVYDCLRWQLARLDLGAHRQLVLERFSGTLCVDELHLGPYTLLLATDPLADLTVGFALVGANDQEHMGRFLGNLARWGLSPKVVVSDGSNLYPQLLATIWPEAAHQLCVFHLLRDVLNKVLAAVRRLRQAKARRGRDGRPRGRGRPSKRQQARRQQRGPTARDKAALVWKHCFLIVKKASRLTEVETKDLESRCWRMCPSCVCCGRSASPSTACWRNLGRCVWRGGGGEGGGLAVVAWQGRHAVVCGHATISAAGVGRVETGIHPDG